MNRLSRYITTTFWSLLLRGLGFMVAVMLSSVSMTLSMDMKSIIGMLTMSKNLIVGMLIKIQKYWIVSLTWGSSSHSMKPLESSPSSMKKRKTSWSSPLSCPIPETSSPLPIYDPNTILTVADTFIYHFQPLIKQKNFHCVTTKNVKSMINYSLTCDALL